MPIVFVSNYLFWLLFVSGSHSSFSFFHSCSRDEFKALLREVRHNNRDSLSGVSMEFIVQQVKLLIEQREKSSLQASKESVGVTKGRGRYVDRNAQPERKPGKVRSIMG